MAKRLTALFPGYFPSVSWWQRLAAADRVILLDGQIYSQRAGMNRAWIKTSAGKKCLVVPVLRRGFGTQVADKEIDGGSNWRRTHTASLASNYRNAPYFDAYYPHFEALYRRRWRRLLDLNLAGIDLVLGLLRWSCDFVRSSDLSGTGSREARVRQALRALSCSTYILASEQRDYFDVEPVVSAGFHVHCLAAGHREYTQQFDLFSPNLSIIDLLMNEGPMTTMILRDSKTSAAEPQVQGGEP